MGIAIVDKHTIGHFGCGSLGYYILYNQNVSISKNFYIANGLHLLMELLEHNKDPMGRVLESNINHLTDIIAFLIGWILAYLFKIEKYIPQTFYPVICIFMIYTVTLETVRELYPNNTGIFNGCYKDS